MTLDKSIIISNYIFKFYLIRVTTLLAYLDKSRLRRPPKEPIHLLQGHAKVLVYFAEKTCSVIFFLPVQGTFGFEPSIIG